VAVERNRPELEVRLLQEGIHLRRDAAEVLLNPGGVLFAFPGVSLEVDFVPVLA
jgi:hypothetical protein